MQRPATTKWSLWGEWGTINWTWDAMQIQKDGETKPVVLPPGHDYEMVYWAEIAHFLDAVCGNIPYQHSVEDEKRVLEIMQAAERNATGR